MKQNHINKAKNTKESKKKLYDSPLPIFEEAKMSLPPNLELLSSEADGTPTLIDKESCGATFTVANSSVYTLRLGVHCYSEGLGAFRDDCAVACSIPTTPNAEQSIIGLFFVPEIYPVSFMDVIRLKAAQPFMLRYLWGSAVLESNRNSFGFPLGSDAIRTEKDMIIIFQNGFHNQIHDCHRLYFDVLRFQVEVAFTK